jgi:ornithine cyclodeaminase
MRFVTAEEIAAALDRPSLIAALERAFSSKVEAPLRHRHVIEDALGERGTLLLMPAWSSGDDASFLGVKALTVFPENAKRDLGSLSATYLLMSGETGFPLAAFDGHALTAWRTGAASALAAKFLAREDAKCLLMVGAGALAPHLVRSHATVRPIEEVLIWNRTAGRASALVEKLRNEKFKTRIVSDLEAAVRSADIISCATLSTTPLIKGAWLKEGMHLDLVGGFTPKMREADNEAIRRAQVYVDTNAALTEAGDLVGVLKQGDLQGDLSELCRGATKGRLAAGEITLFKSVGTAVEDLAAAALIWERLGAS